MIKNFKLVNNHRLSIETGFFLLILAIMGNFTAETLGCQTQKILKNMIVKNIVIFFILFFVVDFSSKSQNNPYLTFKISLIIYILFILFSRNISICTLIVFMLLSLSYVLVTYRKYYQNKNMNEEKKNIYIKNINKFIDIGELLIIIILFIGFALYFKKQYKDHKNNWSTITFIFGKNNCNSIK